MLFHPQDPYSNESKPKEPRAKPDEEMNSVRPRSKRQRSLRIQIYLRTPTQLSQHLSNFPQCCRHCAADGLSGTIAQEAVMKSQELLILTFIGKSETLAVEVELGVALRTLHGLLKWVALGLLICGCIRSS